MSLTPEERELFAEACPDALKHIDELSAQVEELYVIVGLANGVCYAETAEGYVAAKEDLCKRLKTLPSAPWKHCRTPGPDRAYDPASGLGGTGVDRGY